jgi:type II secretory pathway pseudopilin PulG
MTRLLRRLRREESGFTLVELLVACLIGIIILLASFMMLDSSIVLTGKVTDRVDRTQRARGAMETMTRELRSQVCPSAGQPALIDAQDYSVKFYSFMGLRPFVPDIRQIAWDTNTNSIIESTWAGSGTPGNFTWASSPTTKTILTDVKPPYVSGTSGPRGPVFKYYAPGGASPFTSPVGATNLAATAKITIDFVTYAQSRNTTGTTTTLQNEVFVRTADPNGAAGSTAPECA